MGSDSGTGQAGGPTKALILGGILGVDAVGNCVALASLVFAGPLATNAGTGTALFLLATLISTLALIRFGGINGALGIAQDSTIAIIAPAVGAAAAVATGSSQAGFATGMMILGTSTILSGLAMWVIGHFEQGRFARLLPYPVSVGFLAGSGCILSISALSLIGGGDGGYLQLVMTLIGSRFLTLTLPTLILAVSMIIGERFFGGVRALLACLLVAFAAFYLALWVFGMSSLEASSIGLLPPPTTGFPLKSLNIDLIGAVNWHLLWSAMPEILVVILISLVGLMLNTTGAELAMGQDVDINRELRVTGLTNMLIGLFGGLASYLSAGSSIMAHRTGLDRRRVAIGYCAMIGLGLVLAGPIVAAVPIFLSAGLLLFIGLSMLNEWLLGSLRRLLFQEWLIVFAIVAVTIWHGMLVAILAGLAFALVIFVVSYARVPVLRRALSKPARRSNVDRSPAEEAFLRDNSNRIRIAPLQGYLFFGSIDLLFSEIQMISKDQQNKTWLLLDFTLVSGMDSSACAAIEKLSYSARRWNLDLAICGLSDDLKFAFDRWHAGFMETSGIRLWTTVDQTLEAIEDQLLDESTFERNIGKGLPQLLKAFIPGHPRTADLIAALRQLTFSDGEVIISQGTRTKDIYIVEDGRVGVVVHRPGSLDLRIRSMTAGAIVGEVAAYLDMPRQANIVAEGCAVVWCLSAEILSGLERDDFELAALIHSLMAKALAEKLIRNNIQILDR